jgi:hypothetical protein
MSVSFDSAACIQALTQHLTKCLLRMQQEYLNEARSHMRTPEGADSLHEGEVRQVAGFIAATVVGGAWAAMDNYGRGSLMDTSNPKYAEYRGSELWNPARFDNAIRGRPRGAYTDIFGRGKVSQGRLEGVDLEQTHIPLRGDYQPWPPSHALETAARWMSGRAKELLKEAILTFPWHRFIIAKPDQRG